MVIDKAREWLFPPRKRGRGRPKKPVSITQRVRRFVFGPPPTRYRGQRGPDLRPRKQRWDYDTIDWASLDEKESPDYKKTSRDTPYVPEPDFVQPLPDFFRKLDEEAQAMREKVEPTITEPIAVEEKEVDEEPMPVKPEPEIIPPEERKPATPVKKKSVVTKLRETIRRWLRI